MGIALPKAMPPAKRDSQGILIHTTSTTIQFGPFHPQRNYQQLPSTRAKTPATILSHNTPHPRNGRRKGYGQIATARVTRLSNYCTGKTGGKTGGKAGADNSGKSQKSHSAKAGLQVCIIALSRQATRWQQPWTGWARRKAHSCAQQSYSPTAALQSANATTCAAHMSEHWLSGPCRRVVSDSS